MKQEERREKELLSSHQIIEEKNRLITSSIKYAERIQTAILPPLELIKENSMTILFSTNPKTLLVVTFIGTEYRIYVYDL